MFVTHAFEPVYDSHSTVLILGTMPSPQSIKHGFYYSHPQNRFWPLMAALYEEPVPSSPDEKRAFALRHGIALWDVLASCEIKGAADSTIRSPIPNDFTPILQTAPIKQIFTTGKTAFTLFQKLVEPHLKREAIYLPSTSPANQALFPWEKLLATWRELLQPQR
jgi:hypoxanthine-DNA glycosylase